MSEVKNLSFQFRDFKVDHLNLTFGFHLVFELWNLTFLIRLHYLLKPLLLRKGG